MMLSRPSHTVLSRAKKLFMTLSYAGIFFVSACSTVTPPKQVPAPVAPPASPVLVPPPPLVPPTVTTAVPKPVPLKKLSPEQMPLFIDDADTASLRAAAWQSSRYFHSLPPRQSFVMASDTYTAADFAESMDTLVAFLDNAKTSTDWISGVVSQFVVYQSNGSDSHGEVTFSSYYEPTISARLQRTSIYRYPLYGRPNDLIDVDLGLFDPSLQGARWSGRRSGRKLVPYYTRSEIDSNRQLDGQALEIAWAKDPLDIFFLQIEGSGFLDVGDGQPIKIGYDGDNGRRFRSVGKYLIDSGRVSASGFGHEGFQHFMSHHLSERQSIMNVDERYVFFQLDTSTSSADAIGNIQVPLTAGRSIATDPKIFPKGMLAWVDVRIGSHEPPRNVVPLQRPTASTHIQRFMVNQDEGGAIQGSGRVDFFAGHGAQASEFANHLWHPGTLYFLVKRKS